MDYLDPRKRRRHTILLYLGYVLIGVAVLIATIVLVYQARGFGIDKKGGVIQNGLVFISSKPTPATIYLNGNLQGPKTSARLALPESTYSVRLQRSGYRDWQRKVAVEGGKVAHYDYPLLIPKSLASTKLAIFDQAPALLSQSPDKRWLIVATANDFAHFNVYDLKNPTKAPTSLALPEAVLTAAKANQSWQNPEWADDSQHVVLQHVYDDTSEYIELDRQAPEQSINLTQTLGNTKTTIKLIDRKYDKFYLYDAAALTLGQASLRNPAVTAVLSGVINFQSYGNNTILYATAVGASTGKIRIELKSGDRLFTVRSLPANSAYLLDLTKYNNTLYVVLGAASENKVYIYRDPAGQIGSDVFKSPTPLQVLRVSAPSYVSFSGSAQYIVAENGPQFSVYDIENKRGYNYSAQQPLDAPQLHASWMDGDRLTYISGGQQQIFDYDYQNRQMLGKADANFKPIFAPDYKYSYTVSGTAPNTLLQTGLLIPSEL